MATPTPLPTPPPGWPSMMTQAMNSIIGSLTARLGDIELKRTQAGRIALAPVASQKIGEVICDGAIYSKKGLPELARALGTTFNTGGETADQFRVPNLPSPKAGLEYRVSTGASGGR